MQYIIPKGQFSVVQTKIPDLVTFWTLLILKTNYQKTMLTATQLMMTIQLLH